ncbi:MAG: minichromosome maintenance protein MCM [Candidatus Micrarchaeota archaeon]
MEQQDISSFVSFFQDFYKLQYADKINELLVNYPDKRSLQLDYRELERFDPEMADRLIKMPEKLIKAAEEALLEKKPALPGGLEFKPNVRFFGLPADTMLIQHLSSSNLNEMVAFKGVVTKRAEVMHRVKKAAYHCDLCGHDESYYVTKDFRQPKKCSECKKLALVQVDDKSEFVDIQRAEIQELLERVRGGAPAAHVELLFEDDSVNLIAPGDNVEIAGIMRLKQPMKPRQKQEMVYGRYIEINSVTSMKRDFEEIEISKEDEERIRELAKDPRITEYIVKSVAPAIYGHEEAKKALTLQLFGGTRGKTMKGGAAIRDDIHILLIGDPGIAKSRFLLSVNDLAPKSIYVSGKSVSGAGLTVSAEKDELGEGGWTLKAGAVVLASGGIVEVDEFDKVSEDDRAALHEAMETQSISVAKAGIVAKFKSKTSILAAANPKYGRFDQSRNLAEQFDVPPTLLSRFDLIFPIVDVLDEEKDTKLAEHILATHRGEFESSETEGVVDKEMLRKYISYARRYVVPKLTKEASDKIRDFYVTLRGKSRDAGAVAITPRYLEGLVRLAEANAKIKLSETVGVEDADAAVSLLNYVMRQVMVDRETGMLDVDTITTGKPKSTRDKLQKFDTVLDIIREALRYEETVSTEKVLEEAEKAGVDRPTAERIVQELLRKGDIYEKEHGYIKMVGGK